MVKEHAYDEIGYDDCRDFDKMANALYKLGVEVLNQLKMIRAFQAGSLVYQQLEWLGNDLVMQRLDLDRIIPAAAEEIPDNPAIIVPF